MVGRERPEKGQGAARTARRAVTPAGTAGASGGAGGGCALVSRPGRKPVEEWASCLLHELGPMDADFWQEMLTCRKAVGGRFVEKSINSNELYGLY